MPTTIPFALSTNMTPRSRAINPDHIRQSRLRRFDGLRIRYAYRSRRLHISARNPSSLSPSSALPYIDAEPRFYRPLSPRRVSCRKLTCNEN